MKYSKYLFGIIIFFAVIQDAAPQMISEDLMKAEALLSAGKTDIAVSELNKAILANQDYRLLLKRAEINIHLKNFSPAISDLTEANKQNPGSGEYGLARIYAMKGDVETSLYHLDLNLRSVHKKSEKEILLDGAFSSVERRQEWRSYWNMEHYTVLERKVSEIGFYISSGKQDLAAELLNEIETEYPASEEVLYSKALIAVNNGRYNEAFKLLSELTLKSPDEIRYLNLLARAQEGSLNSAGATVTYTKILDAGTSDAGILLSRAAAFRKTGENDKALADVNKYLEFYPANSNALSLSGKLYAITGDNLKAIEIFNRNINLHPNDASLFIDRANSYFSARSWELAINDYSMALDLDPGNPEAWLSKGQALINSGRTMEACHDLKRALGLGNKRASELISRNCIK